jgi:hypothetical protein
METRCGYQEEMGTSLTRQSPAAYTRTDTWSGHSSRDDR